MRISKVRLLTEEIEWMESGTMWIALNREVYVVRPESSEEADVLYDVIEQAVDFGIDVWEDDTNSKMFSRIGKELAQQRKRIVTFEARGEPQIVLMRDLLKELVVKEE